MHQIRVVKAVILQELLSIGAPGPYYIYVGGRGITGIGGQGSAPGGFNGGGDAAAYTSSSFGMGSGGGATHVASAIGVLSTLSGNQSAVVIVAGGGGGSGSNHGGSTLLDLGGNGGGLTGGNGLTGNPTYGGTGGTQSAGGTGNIQNGSFGQGGNNSGNNTGGGGGGGWYGGGAAQWEGSGGGSGYIGGVINGITREFGQPGFVSNPDASGNGYVILTRLCDVNVSASTNPICFGDQVTLTTNAGSNISWNTGATTPSITVSPSGNTSYTVSGTSSGPTACTSTVIITVTVNPLPNLSTSSIPAVLCVGNTGTVMATGAISYSWGTMGTQSSATVNPVVTTIYTVTGQNIFGCLNTQTVEMNVNTNSLTVTQNTSVCIGDQINLTASGATSYAWSTGGLFPTIPVSPTANTVYSVTGVDQHGCTLSNSVSVTVNSKPTVSVSTSNQNVCRGEAVTLTASGASTYKWNTGDATAAVTFVLPVNITYNYTVTGTDANGCSNPAFFAVNVSSCTGLDETKGAEKAILIYPNPNNGQFHLEFENNSGALVKIYNVTGAVVRSFEISSKEMTIDLKDENNGLYFIHISGDDKAERVYKVIKQ